MVKRSKEEPCNSSCRREAGCCASKVYAWGLATACPGQEAWGLLGSQGAHMGRILSPKHHRTMGIEPPGSMHSLLNPAGFLAPLST